MAAFGMPADRPNRSNGPAPQTPDDVPVADLSHLYDEPDPRPYYAALGALDYQTPRHVQRLVRWCCAQKRQTATSEELQVIDIGCGYATNAAGLRHGIEPEELYARYGQTEIRALETEALHSADRDFFSDPDSVHVTGIDVARQALEYGLKSGLLSAAFSDDLVENAPSDDLQAIINQAAVIMESGVPIFIFPYVLDTILKAHTGPARPWVVTAPPRYTDISVYTLLLENHGYVLERAHGESLPHRRFVSEQEKYSVIEDQQAMGLDTEREETKGYIFVDIYLARPAEDADLTPLEPLDF